MLRDEVLATFDQYLNCGLLCHGAARAYCDTCRHSILIAFSCKKRGVCPSCGAKRSVKFAEHLYDEVLEEVPNRHVIFTIPKRLRPYFKYDRRLNDLLFEAAWGSIREVLGERGGNVPAAVLTLQTAGEALNFHPHLHGCIADGLFSADGGFTPFAGIDQVRLTQRFGERLLAALHEKELVSDDVVAQILSQQHTGFSVWLGEPFQDSESTRFVARYIERGPVSLQKLSLENNIVTYTTADKLSHEFDALEFLALLSAHVPRPHESLTRYYGYYSCRSRGERKKCRAASAIDSTLPEPKAKPSWSWAACMKRVFEIDPLECPKCKGKMRIVAFLQPGFDLQNIIRSLGLPDYQAPPKFQTSLPHDDLFG